MSIFGNILSKIFHHDAEAATSTSPASPQVTPGNAPEGSGRPPLSTSMPESPGPTEVAQNDNPVTSGSTASSTQAGPAPAQAASAPAQTGAAPAQTVDVAAVLDGLAAKNSQTLDWKHSIVDMLKLLGLDSSLQSRQELAKELNYSGDMHDSAGMNIWLHKQVMTKLAANGGKVPADLRT